jgi:hypothetical protein
MMAIEKKRLDILKWIFRKLSYSGEHSLCWYAASHGNIKILKYLRKKIGTSLDDSTCRRIACAGDLEMMKWARENGCTWAQDTCSKAAASGNFELLKWVRDAGCPWDEDTCPMAALHGHLEILKWARDAGFPCDQEICRKAAISGKLEILAWAVENGCPWNKLETCMIAILGNNIGILKWVFTNGGPFDEPETKVMLKLAAERGKVDVLIWAKENLPDHLVNIDSIVRKALQHDQVPVLKWLDKNGMKILKFLPRWLWKQKYPLSATVWLIGKILPKQFRSIWREVEELVSYLPLSDNEVQDAAKGIIRHALWEARPCMVQSFIELIQRNSRGS